MLLISHLAIKRPILDHLQGVNSVATVLTKKLLGTKNQGRLVTESWNLISDSFELKHVLLVIGTLNLYFQFWLFYYYSLNFLND